MSIFCFFCIIIHYLISSFLFFFQTIRYFWISSSFFIILNEIMSTFWLSRSKEEIHTAHDPRSDLVWGARAQRVCRSIRQLPVTHRHTWRRRSSNTNISQEGNLARNHDSVDRDDVHYWVTDQGLVTNSCLWFPRFV